MYNFINVIIYHERESFINPNKNQYSLALKNLSRISINFTKVNKINKS